MRSTPRVRQPRLGRRDDAVGTSAAALARELADDDVGRVRPHGSAQRLRGQLAVRGQVEERRQQRRASTLPGAVSCGIARICDRRAVLVGVST